MTQRKRSPADSVSEDASKIKLLAAIVENAPVAIYMKDPDGVYLYSNPVDFELSGSAEVVGKTDHELFPESLATEFRREDLIAMQSETPTDFTSTIQMGGEQRTFKKVKFPICADSGELLGVCGVALDITDNLAEQRARAAEEIRVRSNRPFQRLFATLTPQEARTAELLIEGLSDREIAESLHLTPDTVRHHVSHVLKKLRKQSRTQAVISLLRHRNRQ